MSKGILNNRDKMIWDNTHKPDISDVVPVIDDEMDDLLDDHDDKVVSIVGDNMSTLLSSNAAAIRLIAGDMSGIGTTEAVKVGTWDATHDIYARRYTGTVPEITEPRYIVIDRTVFSIISVSGYLKSSDASLISGFIPMRFGTALSSSVFVDSTGLTLIAGTSFSQGTYECIVYYLVSTETPTP